MKTFAFVWLRSNVIWGHQRSNLGNCAHLISGKKILVGLISDVLYKAEEPCHFWWSETLQSQQHNFSRKELLVGVILVV